MPVQTKYDSKFPLAKNKTLREPILKVGEYKNKKTYINVPLYILPFE